MVGCLPSQGSGAYPNTAELVPHSCFATQWSSLQSAQDKYFYCSISDSNCLLLRLSLLCGSDVRAENVLTDQHRVQQVHIAGMNSALSATEVVASS